MSSIIQNADGSYSKTYTDMELSLIKSIINETSERKAADQELWLDLVELTNRFVTVEENQSDVSLIQNEMVKLIKEIDDHADEINALKTVITIDAYSKDEIDQYVIMWKIEEIPHVFASPRNSMFDSADLSDIKVGYAGFKGADIFEPHDHHMPENKMRRYTMAAYVETPREVHFEFFYADRMVFYLNGVIEGEYMNTNGNFGGVAASLSLMFKEGWNTIQVLVANENQRGGLVMESDLYEKVDYLSNLDTVNGMISGDRIQPGTLDESHFAPDMDLVVNTLHATADDVPGVVIGDPNGCGILQIGDKTITKCLNEPFVFDDGIRVNGYIFASQLLIDEDFIRAGGGIFVDKIIDPATGFTKIYEIINDMKLTSKGGIVIEGDAATGYYLTNNMKLMGDPGGGILVTGNAVDGYVITNIMLLTSLGGIEVKGNATSGYTVKNTMRLTVAEGLGIEGFPWTNEGYFLKNMLKITGEGIIVQPQYAGGSAGAGTDGYKGYNLINDTQITAGKGIGVDKIATGKFKIYNTLKLRGKRIKINPTGPGSDGIDEYELINDTLLTTSCGGIQLNKLTDGEWEISNKMALSAGYGGPVTGVTGNACQGYVIQSKWPVISGQNPGIAVSDNGNGSYTISNTGVISLMSGAGINISAMGNGIFNIANTGVLSLVSGTGISVNTMGNGSWGINNTGVTSISTSGAIQGGGTGAVHLSSPAVTQVVSQGDIQASISNNTLYLSYSAPAAPTPTPEPDYTPPPSTGGGGSSRTPGTGSLAYHSGAPNGLLSQINHVDGTFDSDGTEYFGMMGGTFTFNDDSQFTISFTGWQTSSLHGEMIIYVRSAQGSTSYLSGGKITYPLRATNTQSSPRTASYTVRKSEFGNRNSLYIGIGVTGILHNWGDIKFTIVDAGTFS